MPNFNTGFVIFPDLTQLDFTGPLRVFARLPQSTIEYDPAPPVAFGHPNRAPAAVKSALAERYGKASAALRAGIERAALSQLAV